MPRPKVIQQSEFPYHVSARCINRDWFSLPMPLVWKIMSTELTFATRAYNLKIHSFVLMNNHFHLLVSTPETNLSQAMWCFMRQSSLQLTGAGNRINMTYGGRYFRSIIKSSHYFMHAYKYVYANPVKAGLSKTVEDYPYSTLHGLLGKEHLFIPIVEDTLLFDDVESTLSWLNTTPTEENWRSVGIALYKREFALGCDRRSSLPSPLETLQL
ncbi:MAG: transposase [Pseudobdellovibrio sp.]